MGALPKKIKVGIHEYRVEFCDMENLGLCDNNAKVISIQRGVLPTVGLVILFHEMLHAVSSVSNLRLFEIIEGEVDEDKLDGCAEWLCMVLKNNPEFTKLFLERKP